MFEKRKPVAGDPSTQAHTNRHTLFSTGCALAAALFFGEASELGSNQGAKTRSGQAQMEQPLDELQQPRAYAKQQSPRVLDLTSCQKKNVPDIVVLENGTAKQILRTDHGLKVEMRLGSAVRAYGKIFHCEQFHFHTGKQDNAGSEHAVIKKPGQKPHRYPAEIHFVHKAEGGDTAVIGVFVKIGKENKDLAVILKNAPQDASGSKLCNQRFTPFNLLPKRRVPVHYEGSLTTPPYNGPVKWMVLVDPIEISAKQLKQLRGMIGDNARAVQDGKTPVTLDTQVK